MQTEDCFYIGYFSKSIGNKGEVELQLDVDHPEKYYKLESVFVQINKMDKQLVPFFITQILPKQKKAIRAKIEGIDSATDSKSLIGKSAFLPLDLLPPLSGNQFYYHEVKNYRIIDSEKGFIGTVDEILDHATQAILQITHPSNKEILIPISDETILNVDREKQELMVKSPSGLIDIYLD